MVLRGVLKFVAVAVASAAVGIGLSKLTGDDTSSPVVPAGTTGVTTSTSATTASDPKSSATATATTAPSTTPTRTITTSTAPALTRAPAQTSGGDLRVDVISTIVHRVTDDPNQGPA